MKNPAKFKLAFSGIIDLLIGLICLAIFGFIAYFTLEMLGATSQLLGVIGKPYELGSFTAAFTGGLTGIISALLIALGIAFLTAAIFSFSFVKSSFKISKMDIGTAKTQLRKLKSNGSTQCTIALIIIGIAGLIAFKTIKEMGESYVIVAICVFIVAGIFLITGLLKLWSARQIKSIQLPSKQSYNPYQNYPY